MLEIRCKCCNEILQSHSSKTKCCGCENMMTIKGETISANDLTKVEIVSNIMNKEIKSNLKKEDLDFQESRKKRKFKKLEFEIR